MMSMTFGVSSSVTLLFDFWEVHGPAGMVLSVAVVLLLSVFYELLKVWRVHLGRRSHMPKPPSYSPTPPVHADSCTTLNSPSESSLTPIEAHLPDPNTRSSLLQHAVQALLHMLQVTLAYMLMLCVMTYNTWIFLGVIVGSCLGFFISFPLLGQS
ncbi:protein SLC31A2 [Antennarius striatus]|uniref:protein SLC31A2 n=1 Tax=Antennarius striatus TaxID=241820 RepID=UPI0035B23FD8